MKLASLFLALCSISALSALPGVPTLRWANHKYSLVELNDGAVSYKDLIKSVHKEVSVAFEWDVWYGDKGERVELLFDGETVKSGDAESQRIEFKVGRGLKTKAAVKLCDSSGCSKSSEVDVVVADTDGSHLAPIEYVWGENNVPHTKSTDHVVGAYFVEWGVYDRKFPADLIPIPNLTHLLYGFIPMCGGDGINDSLKEVPGSFEALQKSCAGRENFKVTIHDIWGALQKPQKGVTAWDEPYKGNFGQLMAIKHHNPELTILPSIGGWTLSDPFFKLGSTETRALFVASVKEFLQTWKFFDGVDVDWEFPGGKGANPNLGDASVDGKTYVQLLKELREMLDELSRENDGRRYQLTSAISAGYDKIDVVNYDEAQKYLDYLFVMSYDFKGGWSNTNLGYQTPLYAPSWNRAENYTADFAIKRLLDQGVGSSKLVVGVAMYGRGWKNVHDYNDNNPFTGVADGKVQGTWEDGVVDYKDLLKRYDQASFYYDAVAEAPYVFDKNSGDLITFDDARSTEAKGQYVVKHKLGGLFAWEIDADNGDLLNAMNEGLGNKEEASVFHGTQQCPMLHTANYFKYLCPFKSAIKYGLDFAC